MIPGKRVYRTERVQTAPELDGVLDDAAWQQGQWQSDFTQRRPREGGTPTERTEIKVLYDDTNVYIAMRAYDSQIEELEFLRGTRDEFTGDIMGVAFDSYFDQRTSFQFNVTAGGSRIDLVITNDGFDRGWNAVWDARTGREEDAWVAEFEIPLSQLRYAKNETPVWGLHAWRRIHRLQEESNWQLIPQDPPAFVAAYGELHGLDGLRPSRQIELMPYAVAQYNTHPAEDGNPFRTGDDYQIDAGLDAKIGLTSDFTLDLTVNPDFGQIEADPSEVNLSSFETFFPEQRPFFLEGRRVFDFAMRTDLLFYSRRIGGAPSHDPDTDGFIDAPLNTKILGAAKVTGKSRQGTSVGLLYAVTGEEDARLYENGTRSRTVVEPMTHYAIARLEQDFNDGATVVGGMATATLRDITDPSLDFLAEQAFTGGFDLQHRWHDQEWFVEANIVGSHIKGSTEAITDLMENSTHQFQRPDATHLNVDPNATSLSGWGGSVEFGRDAGSRWLVDSSFNWRSPGLELNDIGFNRRADDIRAGADLLYVVREPGRWLRNYEIGARTATGWEYNGVRRFSFFDVFTEFNTNNHWEVEAAINYRNETRAARRLRGGPSILIPPRMSYELAFETDNSRNIQFNWVGEFDDSLETDTSSWSVSPGVEARISDFLNIETNLLYESNLNEMQWVENPDDDGITRYVVGRMEQETLAATVRFDVNFSPRLSLTYYGSLFASSGMFDEFKQITSPLAPRWEDRFARLENQLSFDNESNTYTASDGVGTYSFENPDFDARELQSNLVLRWEYRPGSTLFLVWTQNRENEDLRRGFDSFSEYDRLFREPSENTFLLKVSYWFSI